MRSGMIAVSLCALAGVCGNAAATLNEFSVADGYMNPFSTRVWTYNPQWTFDGGAIGSNYVAQHGYGSGFAFTEPYALVIRNDSAAGNYQFSYAFDSGDLGGVNPLSTAGQRITISFDSMSFYSQNSTTPNSAPMMAMAFGGTRAAPGMRIAMSDSNKLMYSDASNNLAEYGGYTLSSGGWDRISVTMDFTTNTYDLSVDQMSGSGANASNTWVPINTFIVGTNLPMANSLTSMQNLWFECFADPENNLGWQKSFLDHFSGRAVPTPGAGAPFAMAGLVGSMRRRR